MTRHPAKPAGYSLVEILIVLAIVALLATLTVPSYGFLRRKATDAACMGNLRYLGAAFRAFMMDHDNVWPQCPLKTLSMDEEESAWWETTLKPYGVARKHWICLSDESQDRPTPGQRSGQLTGDQFVSSYLVTPFDDQPGSPDRWKQPWLIERSNNHGDKYGPNMLLPDGTITQGIPLPALPH